MFVEQENATLFSVKYLKNIFVMPTTLKFDLEIVITLQNILYNECKGIEYSKFF